MWHRNFARGKAALWLTSVVQSKNCFNDALQDTAFKTPTLILGSCRFSYFDRPKTYQIFQKMALFDLIHKADYPDNTTFSFNVCISIKYEKTEEKLPINFTHS